MSEFCSISLLSNTYYHNLFQLSVCPCQRTKFSSWLLLQANVSLKCGLLLHHCLTSAEAYVCITNEMRTTNESQGV